MNIQNALIKSGVVKQNVPMTEVSANAQDSSGAIEIPQARLDKIKREHVKVSHHISYGKFKSLSKKAMTSKKPQLFKVAKLPMASVEFLNNGNSSKAGTFYTFELATQSMSVLVLGLKSGQTLKGKKAGHMTLSFKIFPNGTVSCTGTFQVKDAKPSATITVFPNVTGNPSKAENVWIPVGGHAEVHLLYNH